MYRLIRKLLSIASSMLMLLAVGCVADTKNVGPGGCMGRGPIPVVTVPSDMSGGVQAQWVGTVQTGTGTAPYMYNWHFGGGAEPNIAATAIADVVMINDSRTDQANYTYSFTVTDSQGLSNTATGQYTVGPVANNPPVIESANLSGQYLTVIASDPDDVETLTASVSDVIGWTWVENQKTQSATGPFTFVFEYYIDFLSVGGDSGTLTITVSDGKDETTEDIATTDPPLQLASDTLYAIPLRPSVPVSSPDSDDNKVTVVVAQGTPANPFQYMNGVGVVVPGSWDDTSTPPEFDPDAGAYYVRRSFDVGATDETQDVGAVSPVDGIWATMSPDSFLLAPDSFIRGYNIGDGLVRIDFNISPIGGSDLIGAGAAGILFNFKLGFGKAGEYPIRFEQFNGVNRTFYSDSTTELYFWGEISNQYTGILNTVTVTE